MKIAVKILKYILISVLSLIVLLFVIAEFAENSIAKIALKKVSESIEAPIEISDVSFSLLRKFPLATIEFQDVWLGGHNYDINQDTLAKIGNLYVSVKILPLLDDEFVINKVELANTEISYSIDPSGKSNFDFLMDTTDSTPTDTTTSSLSVDLEKLEFDNVICYYSDSASKMSARLQINEFNLKGSINDSIIKGSTDGKIKLTDCYVDSTNLNLMNQCLLDFDVEYDNGNISIEEAIVTFDETQFNLLGGVLIDKDINANLMISSPELVIEDLMKYAPENVLNDIGLKYASGKLKFESKVNGIFNDSIMPRVDISMEFNDGTVVMNDYPVVKNISFKGEITNGSKAINETTSVNMSQFHAETNKSSISSSFAINNIDHPQYQVKANISADLSELKPYAPDTLIQSLSGILNANLSTYGILPDKITDNYINAVAQNSRASLNLANVSIRMDSIASIQNFVGNISYTPGHIHIENIGGKIPDYKVHLNDFDFVGDIIGPITDIEKLGLKMTQFHVLANGIDIIIDGTIQNFSSPNYIFKGRIKLDLAELQTLLPDSLVNEMSGSISTIFSSSATLNIDSITTEQINNIAFNKSTFKVLIKDVNVEMPDTLKNVNNISGRINYSNDSIRIRSLKGKASNIDFYTNDLSITKVYNAFLLNQKDTILIRGDFNIGDVDYNRFASLFPDDSTTTQPEPTIEEETVVTSTDSVSNYRFEAKGKFSVKSFKYDKALFENITAKYYASDYLYIIDQFKFDAFKGHTNTSVRVEMDDSNRMTINFKNSSDNIDINQLLVDFDDFKDYGNDNYISRDQLSGTFSTENLNGYFLFKDSLITDSILMSADLLLENGRLLNYPIAVEMGKDYNIDDLDNMKFETIDTKLFVLTNKVYAPLTNIKSNTFDISLFGRQMFNLDCQYHLRFYLKEIWRKGKTNRIERKQSKESKQTKYGGTKGLTSMYAIYKVKNGVTVKSTLEGKDSDARKDMLREIKIKESDLRLSFNPKFVNYEIPED